MLRRLSIWLGVALTLGLLLIALNIVSTNQAAEAQGEAAPQPSGDNSVAEEVVTDPADPRVQQLQAAYNAALNDSVSNYRVAYIAQENTVTSGYLAAADVQITSTWDEVLAFDAAAPLQAIVIRSSAIESVDSEWVRAAYRRGIIVVGVNLFLPELSALTGDNCVSRHGISTDAANTHSGDYFVLYYYRLQPENEADREAINTVQLQNCTDIQNNYHYQLSEGFMQGALDETFARTLAFYLHTLSAR